MSLALMSVAAAVESTPSRTAAVRGRCFTSTSSELSALMPSVSWLCLKFTRMSTVPAVGSYSTHSPSMALPSSSVLGTMNATS